jgi:lactoylglutathione lyase
MQIEHVALWAQDLEALKSFYVSYLGGVSGKKYFNPKEGFSSYFLSFEGGARLELMNNPRVNERMKEPLGFSHIAFTLDGRNAVDTLTKKLRDDGFTVVSGPRTTGDGYYESCVLDTEGNKVELTCPQE